MVPIRRCASRDYMVPCHPLISEPGACANARHVSAMGGHTTFCTSAENMDVDNTNVSMWGTGGPLLRSRERHFASSEEMDDDEEDTRRLLAGFNSIDAAVPSITQLGKWQQLAPCESLNDQPDACRSTTMSDAARTPRCQYSASSHTCEMSVESMRIVMRELTSDMREQNRRILDSLSELGRIYDSNHEQRVAKQGTPTRIAEIVKLAQKDLQFGRCDMLLDQCRSSMECVVRDNTCTPFFCQNIQSGRADCESDARCSYANNMCIPRGTDEINRDDDAEFRKMMCTAIAGYVWDRESEACRSIDDLSSQIDPVIGGALRAGGSDGAGPPVNGAQSLLRHLARGHATERLLRDLHRETTRLRVGYRSVLSRIRHRFPQAHRRIRSASALL